jgi:hypothetical protein
MTPFWTLYDLWITIKALKPDNFAFYILEIAIFDRWNTQFRVLFCLLLKWEKILTTVFEFVYRAACRMRVGRGGRQGGTCSPAPVFGRTVNPISTREADCAHHSTTCPSGFSDLATALVCNKSWTSPFHFTMKIRTLFSMDEDAHL